MITVTLQQIKDASPCYDGWKKVLKANGGSKADFNKPFPLLSILDSNGTEDTLWVISNAPEMSKHGAIWRKFSTWCALQNIELIKDYCVTEDYKLIVKYLETNDLSLREAAESAAWAAESAARAAAGAACAACAAAESAAESATCAAAWAARAAESAAWAAAGAAWSAESAAWAAAGAAWSARYAQEEKLRELLCQ
jgi:hypothetical protein